MKKVTTFILIMLMLFPVITFAQKTWTGATSTAWNTAGNWSPAGVPGSTDNVVIPSAPANQPLISGTSSPVCNNLTVNAGATLTISGTTLNNALLTVSGTATFNGALSIGGSAIRTGTLAAANVVWNSTSTLTAYLNARMTLTGNWTFASGASIDMGNCWVTFTGTGNSTLNSNSSSCKFGSLGLSKTSAATTSVGSSSVALAINSGLQIDAGNTFTCGYNITTVIKGNVNIVGLINFYQGTVSLEGTSTTQSVQMAATGNNVKNLTIKCNGTVTLNNSLNILGNLTIQTGTFNPQNNTIYVTGNWINTAGPAYFTEGTGKVVFNVIINKDGGKAIDQVIQNTENFNVLELNNAYGDLIINSGLVVVTCNQYDWVAGGLNVSQGVFTALDLADNGIFGRYTLSGTGTLNLTNDDGYVDLNGSTINISGGTFNVYGGTTDSYWPFSQNAFLTMSGGVLNFAETGIRVSASTTTLTTNITGGAIKTAKNFSNYRSDFNPAGGTIELYGPTDASLYCVGTAALYGVKINKTASKDGENTTIIYPRIDRETGEVITDESRAQTVNLTSTIIFNGNFVLTSGTFNSNSHTIQAKRDWTNNAGAGSFNPGTGRVIFNGGNYHQYCYNETFNILELNKASGGAFRLSLGTTVTCAVYDWTAGSIDVLANGGTFTALDLSDNGIFGGYYVNSGGTINLYQDIYQYIDLNGSLTFTNGGTMNIYGGNGASQWAAGANASITMNAGTLDFKDQGITLTTMSPNTITENITGGTIRTTGGFYCNRADFTPVGGLLELYGSNNVYLEQSAGTLRDIKINKGPSAVVTVNTNITVVSIEVAGGTLSAVNKIINQDGHLYVENGGTFSLGQGAQLKLATDMSVNVNSGGIFKAIGTLANQATITRSGSFYYYFNVNNGGTISAKYAKFQYPANIILAANAIIDPSFPFDYCTFSNGQGTYIFLNNSQELTIRGANFPTLPPTNTVAKTNNAGRITFRDATGAYSGPGYEYDPYSRIDWTVTQPGLWTGAESSIWYNSGNWDDGLVPNAGTNVVIPATAPNMPEIDAGDWYINSLTVNGSLNFDGGNLTVYGNVSFDGEMLVTSPGSQFVILGDVYWNSGSSAGINQEVTLVCNGNWNFNAGSSVQFSNGSIIFAGTTSKWIRSYSENSFFHDLYIQKTGGAQVGFSDLSIKKLEISGDFKIWPLAKFAADAGQDMILYGDFISNGTFEGNAGKLIFNGVNQIITPNTGDYFNSLKFNQSGTVSVNTVHTSTIMINDNLQIYSGVFAPGNVTIYLAGDWSNPVGPDAFNESNTTVVFNGAGNVQRIYNHENFMTLVLEKSGSGSVLELSSLSNINCQYYNWNDGGLSVVNGSFTAYSLIGGIIGGDVSVSTNGTITMGNLSEQMDLVGRLFIIGGKFNIINGMPSQWPGNGNAQITMSGGEINVYPYGIEIVNNPPYVFVNQITGGKIRTTGSFINHRNDFNPTAGTIEFYGTGDAFLSMNTPSMASLHNVTIDKQTSDSKGGSVTLSSNLLVGNDLKVNEGTFTCSTGNMLVVVNQVDVYGGGVLSFEPGSAFGLYAGCQLIIDQGGTFQSHGTESQPIFVDRFGSTGFYDFGVGGTISSRFTTFNNCGNVIVGPSGYIDPDNAFYHCTFPYAVGAYLMINNSQNVTLRGVQFPNVPISMNVKKTIDQGRVIMKDATGPGAGPAYEYDPYNRIDWAVTQPGLWTGIVSSDWDNPENWDDLSVPTYQTDVLIPEAAPHMPAVSAEAGCKNITVMGEIAIFENNLWVSGNASIYGHVNNDAGFRIFGSLYWQEGSTAVFGDDGAVNILGDWYFNPGSQVNLTNGAVYFSGQMPSSIFSFSSQSAFNKLQLMKDPAIQVNLDVSSDQPLNINGDLLVLNGNGFYSYSAQDINLKGSNYNHGVIRCEAGRFVLNGVDQSIQPNVSDYFNTLVFNQTGIATISNYHTNVLNVKKDLIIESGVFSPGSSKIKIGRDWINNVGNSAFTEGTSRVILNGNGPQFSSSEHFNILELDKPVEYLYLQDNNTIICDVYDWTNGGMWIAGEATFVANDLADDGIYGFIHLFDGNVELYQDAGQTVDLRGNLRISGGEFKVWGGNDETVWGTNTNATLTMINGILNFNDHTIKIQDAAPYSFTSTITGGTIRTQKSFFAQSPGFNPTGGTVELYGEQNSALLSTEGGSFYNVTINKPSDFSTRAAIWSSNVKNNFVVAEGLAEVGFGQELECWNNLEIQYGGWLATNSSTISMKYLSSINVFQNGQLSLYGYDGAMSRVKGIVSGEPYTLSILGGGYLEAMFTIFENLPEQGVYLAPGAVVNPNYSFSNCEFRNGMSGSTALLTVDNDQDIIIENAVFPANTWGGQYNVRKLVDAGSVTFVNATGDFAGSVFENDPFDRIFWGDEFATHPISIPAGWSGISSYVLPGQPALEDVFAPISDELIIAQTMTGMYFPGENINTIGNWERHSAYKVKTSAACTLNLTGDYETDLTVSLNAGWSLLPVVTPDGAPAADLLSPVNGFVIAKDVAGTGVYWPQYNLNSIGYLLPGKAYYVLMTDPGVVEFQTLSGLKTLTGYCIQPYPIHHTSSTHTIAVLPAALREFEPGSLIGAFDQAGNCFGATVYNRETISLTVFGDDPTTAEKDGFYEGERMWFKDLSEPETQSVLAAVFDPSLHHSDGLFYENGLSVITGFEAISGTGHGGFGTAIGIYPNPTNGLVNISGLKAGAEIEISDIQGKKMLVESNGSYQMKTFDLKGLTPGIYFIKIQLNGEGIFRKIVLK